RRDQREYPCVCAELLNQASWVGLPMASQRLSRPVYGIIWWGVMLTALLACIGCGSSKPVPAPTTTALPVALVVSGDTAGWLVPCGCTANQSGGLLRRGTYVRQLKGDHALIVADAGGAPGGTSPYDQLRFEAILNGELAMGIVAHNLGGPEAALGA